MERLAMIDNQVNDPLWRQRRARALLCLQARLDPPDRIEWTLGTVILLGLALL